MLKLLLASSAIVTVLVLSQPAKSAIIADLGVNPTRRPGRLQQLGRWCCLYRSVHVSTGRRTAIRLDRRSDQRVPQSDRLHHGVHRLVVPRSRRPRPRWRRCLAGRSFRGSSVPLVPSCQGVAGSAVLDPGNYFLDLAGSGGGTSGYGGNLTTFAVPAPVLGGGLPGLLMAIGGLFGWRRLRRH